MAALRQHERPIVIEDQDLARPFVRLLRTRDMKLRPLGAMVAEMMSYTIRRCYGSDIENDWYIGRYILPGNVQKVILKSKVFPPCGLRDMGPPEPTTTPARPVAALPVPPAMLRSAAIPLRRVQQRATAMAGKAGTQTTRAMSLGNGGSDGARTRDLRRDRPTL